MEKPLYRFSAIGKDISFDIGDIQSLIHIVSHRQGANDADYINLIMSQFTFM